MNNEIYKNQKPRPRKAEFNTTFFYSGGKVLGKGSNLEEVRALRLKHPKAVEETTCDEDAYKAAMREFEELRTKLEAMFQKNLFQDNGVPDNEFTQRLYRIAYNQSHDEGFNAIADTFGELAELHDLAKKVYG